MPFTPTHILAIVPIFSFCRVLSFCALAIGSMIPDFPMFLNISTYKYSHSIPGIFLYCIPAGFMVHLVFEKYIKKFCIDLSPAYVRSRLNCYRESNQMYDFRNTIILAFSFLLGSFSHIVWDAFTHKWGWGVVAFPVLQQKITIFSYLLPYYKLIQHGSTIVGLPLLALFGALSLSKLPTHQVENYVFTNTKVYIIVISFLLLPVLISMYHLGIGAANVDTILGYTIKQSIGAGIILLTIYSLINHQLERK